MNFLDTNKRIGVGLCAVSGALGFLGVVLFFDRRLLALANFAFLVGVVCLVGVLGATRFFFRRDKLRGSIAFFVGFALILVGWPIVGVLVQSYGVWRLFYALIPNVVASLRLSPLGFIFGLPGIKQLLALTRDRSTLLPL